MASDTLTPSEYAREEKELHRVYDGASDFYASVFGQYGNRLPEKAAIKLADMHSTSLGALIDEGLATYPGKSGLVYGTAHVFAALGY